MRSHDCEHVKLNMSPLAADPELQEEPAPGGSSGSVLIRIRSLSGGEGLLFNFGMNVDLFELSCINITAEQ